MSNPGQENFCEQPIQMDVTWQEGVGTDQYGNTYKHGQVFDPQGEQIYVLNSNGEGVPLRYAPQTEEEPFNPVAGLRGARPMLAAPSYVQYNRPVYAEPEWDAQRGGPVRQSTMTTSQPPSGQSNIISSGTDTARDVWERFRGSRMSKIAAFAGTIMIAYPILTGGTSVFDKEDGVRADLQFILDRGSDVVGFLKWTT